MRYAILIPAYDPDDQLLTIIGRLSEKNPPRIVIVDDGSSAESSKVFAAVSRFRSVTLLRHPANRGKGSALKTGLAHIQDYCPDLVGTMTMDADGQHAVEDLFKLGSMLERSQSSLIIGARNLDEGVPFRSRAGNLLTRWLLRAFAGMKMADSQTGLRGIPRTIVPSLLALRGQRYDFELEMLLLCRKTGVPIIEEPIQTIYLDNNRASHFRPLLDSLRIFFSLLRFLFN